MEEINTPASKLLSMEQSFNLTRDLAIIDKLPEKELRTYARNLLKLYVGREAMLRQLKTNDEFLSNDNSV